MLRIKKIPALVAMLATGVMLVGCNDEQPKEAQLSQDFNAQASYAIGYAAGMNFLSEMVNSQKAIINYDASLIARGVKDALNKSNALENDEAIQKVLIEIQNKVETEQGKATEANNAKLTEEFSKKDGVKKTESGILYRIEKMGEGKAISAEDVVKVEYTGKLANGEVFDSSDKHGAVEFPLSQVIPGWTEALQLIKEGGEMEMVIPSELAYGDSSIGAIPANATLYFSVKVLEVKAQ